MMATAMVFKVIRKSFPGGKFFLSVKGHSRNVNALSFPESWYAIGTGTVGTGTIGTGRYFYRGNDNSLVPL